MAESGDWITPRLYGKPWFEKPPLLYWGGAIFFKLLGEDHPETAARLPSAISALLATLALGWLAWRTYGQECARWLLLLLPTSVGMIGFSHACATDMPFAGMLTIAMVCAAVVLDLAPHRGSGFVLTNPDKKTDSPILPRAPWLALLLFGFFLGLAVLAKGPAGIILIGGAVFFWGLFTKRWRDSLRLLHPAAIAAFCLTALPWYILCARRNPDFFRIFIIEHNFKRYLTPEFQHVQPFWFYLPVLLIGLFPWMPGAIAAIIRARSRVEWTLPLHFFLLCWFLWPVLFFSLSKSKLPGYILPALPPAIVLTLSILADKAPPQLVSRTFVLATGITFVLSALAFVVFDFADKIPNGTDLVPDALHSLIYVPLLLGGVISLLYGRRNRATSSLVWGVVTVLSVALGLYLNLYSLDPLYSARFGARAAPLKFVSFRPEYAAVYQESRGVQYGLNFYFRRELPTWSEYPSAEWVFTGYKTVGQLEQTGFKCPRYIVFRGVFPCQRLASLGGDSGGRQPH